MKVIGIPIVTGSLLEQSPRTWKRDLVNWRSVEKLRTSRPQFGYLKEFWRSKETCCHSVFSEKLLVRAGVKNLKGIE